MIRKSNKMILTLTIFISILVFLEKCTVINIVSPPIFKNKKYINYSYLHKGIHNTKSEIIQISDSPYNIIAYDDISNYFIVYGDNKIRKINSRGVHSFTLNKGDGISFSNLGPFVFTDSTVYDLSQENIEAKKIKTIIHADNELLKFKGFMAFLNNYYSQASVVIYANTDDFSANDYKVYLKIDDDWMGLYIAKQLSEGINFYSQGDVKKKYPEKFNKLLLLKNPVNNVYSSRSSGNENFSSVPDALELTKESKLDYLHDEEINISYYQKENTSSVIAYTNIPISFVGTAYFDLKIRNEIYKFKENGFKSIGLFSAIKHDISYFLIPHKYFDNSEVSFLKLFPSSNSYLTGSKGLYIVRPLKE